MKNCLIIMVALVALNGCSEEHSVAAQPAPNDQLSPGAVAQRNALARCMTEKGWRLYASATCPHCLKQREILGDAYSLIDSIECYAHAPNSQVELCVEKKILKVPAWSLEKEGKVLKRVTGAYPLKKLAELSGCEFLEVK